MGLKTTDGLGHKGFGRPISQSRGRRDRRVSLLVLTVLGVAIMVSAAALRLDDSSPAGHLKWEAWNIVHGPAAALTNGG